MKRTWLLVFVLAAAMICGCMQKIDYSKYEPLVNPIITEKPAQKVLVVESAGDPNKTGTQAISALYGMYFRLKATVKGMPMPGGPKSRWPGFSANTLRDQWKGIWALPVPDSVTVLPAQRTGPAQVKLDTWKYGTVAEILHKGPYSNETQAIEKLRKFITDSGYVISGDHEEEYLKGPGMFWRGDPQTYLTIIRYEVTKAAPAGKAKKK
jgi:hypothetical protein